MNDLKQAFSADVMAELARPVASYDPRDAEMVPGKTPKWHVVETYPNSERKAAKKLAAHRFGIFVPESEETVIVRGRKIDRTSLMFPGYIFVFVWDVLEHRSRIEAIDGVMQLVLITGPIGPQAATLTDEQIDEIRAVENTERPLPAIMIPEDIARPNKNGRWRKNQKRLYEMQRAQMERDNEVVGCRAWSPFQEQLLTVDGELRNQTLRNALGLP